MKDDPCPATDLFVYILKIQIPQDFSFHSDRTIWVTVTLIDYCHKNATFEFLPNLPNSVKIKISLNVSKFTI